MYKSNKNENNVNNSRKIKKKYLERRIQALPSLVDYVCTEIN